MDVSQFKDDVVKIIRQSDLEKVSARSVRKTLEAKLDIDLSSVKKELSELITICFEEILAGQEKVRAAPETEQVSGVKDSVPNGKAIDDEKVAAHLQELYNKPRELRASSKKPIKKKRTVSKLKDTGDSSEPVKKRKPNPNSPFNRPLILSESLASFVGQQELSRPQVVKKIWDYVKEHGLQDSSDKRYILCDAKLQTVFKTEKVHMFTLNKILKEHVKTKSDVQ